MVSSIADADKPYDKITAIVAGNLKSEISGLDFDKTWTCNWDTISLAQVSSFLLISAPKLSSSYSMNPMQQGGDGLLQVKLKTFNAQGNQSNNLTSRDYGSL